MNILYLAPIDWDFIQRLQHLARRLAEYFNFYYIQPLGLRNITFSDYKRILKRSAGLFRPKEHKDKGGPLRIVDVVFFPFGRLFNGINIYMLKKRIASLYDDERIIWITSPSSLATELLSHLDYKALVYEMMDDYPKIHPSRARDILAAETFLINTADLIIVSSASLHEKAKKINADKEVVLVNNAVDCGLFAGETIRRPVELQGMEKIAGYIGTVEEWIDFEMIASLADKRRDIDIVFVGPMKTQNVPRRKNIHFLGKRDYQSMPDYIGSFDVCLIPFKAGEFADSINPVKLYEYFAMGKPVVSFRMRELSLFKGLVYSADDGDDFILKVEDALREKDGNVREERIRIARRNDWSDRALALKEILSKYA